MPKRRTLFLVLALAAFGAGSVDPAGSAEPDSSAVSARVVPAQTQRSFRDWYELGGGVMHALTLCSVLAFGVSLERSWRLRRSSVMPRELESALRDAQAVGKLSECRKACQESDTSLGRIAASGLASADPVEPVQSMGAVEAQHLQRNLPLLAALANLATMLGLLGTVLGMIDAFDRIAVIGTGDARVVAGGIFRALVTTAAGLGVGIFALAAHTQLSRRATELITELEEISAELFAGGAPADETATEFRVSG